MNNKNNSSLLQNILKVMLLALIAIAPTYFVISHNGAKLEFTTPVITTTVILCLVLVAAAFSIFGYDYQLENNTKKENDNISKQYAPIYTTEERIKYFVKHSIWAVPLFLVVKFWFMPFIDGYSKIAHCINYGNFTGLHVVFYGFFVGLPVLMALTVFLSVGIRNLKIIKLEQSPLPNEKVFTQTEYVYGSKAKLRAYGVFAYILLILGLGVQGYFWANETMSDVSNKSTEICKQSTKL